MSDSGEGLVDAEARLQEQIDAREADRQRRNAGPSRIPRRLAPSNRCVWRASISNASSRRRRTRPACCS